MRQSVQLSCLRGFCIAALAFMADQFLKAYFQSILLHSPAGRHSVQIASFFSLTPGWNPGISFGFLATAGQTLVIFITGGITFLIAVWMIRERDRWTSHGLALVAGGAAGNLFDRIRYGAVFDFLDFYAGEWRWPTFNGADIAINLGVGILLWRSFRDGAERTVA